MVKHCKWVLALLAVAVAAPAYAQTGTGNGAISGPHYNLNLVGRGECSSQPLDDTGRHTIQVLLNFSDENPNDVVGDDPGNIADLDKTNKIFLVNGGEGLNDSTTLQDDFEVLDGNACDGDGAAFRLPANPFTCPVNDPECLLNDPTFQEYWIFLRELGKPGGSGQLTTCGIEAGEDGLEGTNDDEVVCSSENVLLVREAKKPVFKNVTKELTTLVLQVDTDGDDVLETIRIGIFDPLLYEYFWDYDNNGLRLVQMRFYAVPPTS